MQSFFLAAFLGCLVANVVANVLRWQFTQYAVRRAQRAWELDKQVPMPVYQGAYIPKFTMCTCKECGGQHADQRVHPLPTVGDIVKGTRID